ncbi:MAG: metallopeptidase family protein, partial [Chloroflexi bacterium]|nr:metallopeptidase family protein [Chloroflexota bacterium]
MHRDRFRRLVQRAVDSLPPALDGYLDNLAIVIEREPTAEDLADSGLTAGSELFGLYIGTPLTDRDEYHMTLPDRIVIYQGPLERSFHPRTIPAEVRRTVLHELAHHFGFDEAEM